MKRELTVACSLWMALTFGCGEPDVSEEELAQDEAEVETTSSAILGTFVALPSLPAVTTAWGFALTASADDGSARLGFMFTDATYRASLLAAGKIANLGGVYDGPQAYATYKIQSSAWNPYEGRTTPQTYAYSELAVANNASYYTTNYPSFGGLISAIRNGGTGVYALTPAFTTRKAHSIAVPLGSTNLYSLMAQSGATGLTFSKIAISQFGVTFPNAWVNAATLEPSAASVAYPQLEVAGAKMAASYILGANAVIRATNNPSTVTSATNVPVIGGCTNAVLADIAWNGTYLYAACVDVNDVLTVKRASLANLASVTWSTVSTSITGAIDELDLEADLSGNVSFAARIGSNIKVWKNITDALPNYDEVRSGSFDLARTSNGIVLVVCDLTGDRIVRTWVSP